LLPTRKVPPQAEGHVPTAIPPDGLPQVALDQMDDTALTQLAAHVGWLISSDNTSSVSLPAIAEQAVNNGGDQFVFEGLPQAAVDHMDDLAFAQLATSLAPLDNVPPQAESHVPTAIPPDGLPQAALDHMDDAALTQLAAHVDWLLA